jgi:hypothetical protein
MPWALVWSHFFIFFIDNELFEGLGGSRGAVQVNVTSSWRWRGLVCQRLRYIEVVNRRRTDGPRVAQDGLLITVENRELW